jgi:hypothetical protein
MMMMKVTRLFLVMLLFAHSMQAREISIHVAVTSDVHARLFPYDFILDRPVESSLAHVNYLF